MNRSLTLALVSACMAAGPALADDISVDPHQFVSTLSRAQVKEELNQFRHGGVNPWADDYNLIAQQHGTSSRAEVRAAYLASRQDVAAFNGEDSGSAYMSRIAAAHAHAPMTEVAVAP